MKIRSPRTSERVRVEELAAEGKGVEGSVARELGEPACLEDGGGVLRNACLLERKAEGRVLIFDW